VAAAGAKVVFWLHDFGYRDKAAFAGRVHDLAVSPDGRVRDTANFDEVARCDW